MTLIAGIDFHFDISFHDLDLKETELYLNSIVSKYSDMIFSQKTSIHTSFAEGSLKVKLAVLGAIYLGIGQYGSLRSGIDYMIKDAKYIKELVTHEIIRNGLNEHDIIDSRRIYCDTDRIRRILLAIERLESQNNLSEQEYKKRLAQIKTSVKNLCYSISEEDAGLFAGSISEKYRPQSPEIMNMIDKYRLLAREEDIHPKQALPDIKGLTR